MNITNSRIIHINSSDRITGTNENFVFSFNLSASQNYTSCCILSASIPISYYMIQSGYNTFTLKEDSKEVEITVEAGNYNTHSFALNISSLLTTNSPNGYTYSITMNNPYTQVNTGKFIYTVGSSSGTPNAQLIFKKGSLAEKFGFDEEETATFSSNTLTSKNVVNFIPEQTLYLYSNLIQTTNNDNGIIQEFYASNDQPYSCIKYTCPSVEAYSKDMNTHRANSFSLVLMNEKKEVMDLNGRNILLTILLYKKDDFFDIAKKYIKYSVLSS